MGKVAFLAAGVAVLLSGLPGCEVLLNVGGLTERGLDDAAVAADTSAASPVDGHGSNGWTDKGGSRLSWWRSMTACPVAR